MISLTLIILTMDLLWNPNPAAENVTRYEVAIAATQAMTNATVTSVPATIAPDGKVYYSIPNWDTSVEKFYTVRAINAVDSSDPSEPYRVGKPQVPTGQGAKKH